MIDWAVGIVITVLCGFAVGAFWARVYLLKNEAKEWHR